MSMELIIFSDKQLGSVQEWQAAIDAEGFPLRLSADVIFDRISGFFPMHLRGELTGFECYHEDPDEIIAMNPDLGIDHPWKFALAFRWLGSKWNEFIAAWMAATAYIRATDGIIIDGEDLKFYTAAQARAVVDDNESPATLARLQAIRDELRRKE